MTTFPQFDVTRQNRFLTALDRADKSSQLGKLAIHQGFDGILLLGRNPAGNIADKIV
jgi:hypothetical protein